jgi:hypothetical protein
MFTGMSFATKGLVVALFGLGCTFLVLVLIFLLIRLLKRFN